MTNWHKYLANLQQTNPLAVAPAVVWYNERPTAIKLLIRDFPPMTEVELDVRPWWVVGYDEPDALHVTPVNPRFYWDLALQRRKAVCASHFSPKDYPARLKALPVMGAPQDA